MNIFFPGLVHTLSTPVWLCVYTYTYAKQQVSGLFTETLGASRLVNVAESIEIVNLHSPILVRSGVAWRDIYHHSNTKANH